MLSKIIQDLATHLGVAIVMKNQEVVSPTYPYVTYDVINSDFDEPHQRIRVQKLLTGNMVQVTNTYRTSLRVELSFYHKGNTGDLLDTIIDLKDKAWFWLNEAGRDLCKQYNLVPILKKQELKKEEAKDTTTTDKKHRVWFEFVLKGSKDSVSQIEPITGVDYKVTIKK